jgi:hypothetical protein
VQEAMLSVVIRRKRKEEIEVETAKFEQAMFINNPPLYKEYMDKKKEEEVNGNKDVQWLAPSSVEEAAELVSLFGDIDRQLKEMDENPAPQIDFLSALGGINLDELGGED